MNDFLRITQDPAVMGGKPFIRGQRVTVGMIAGRSSGRTIDELLGDYPYLRAPTSLTPCATRRGEPKNARSISPAHPDAALDRHEFALMGSDTQGSGA